ncbi:MAG: UDP-N-acetylmuramate--L-alanine ligase [Candidatus Levybacteria bacterium]|nr:UDP-N-acetylmuramate--L-alanine ligase [Candidatus Levybacteria bacterium]
MQKITSIHFVGIKGVGMAPLAIIAKEAGIQISGSDIADEFITDKALAKVGIKPFVDFSKDHVKHVDLVITTGAHGGFDNIEVLAAKEQGIPVWTQGRAVGEFMSGTIFERIQKGISVTGTHGKTTTTAMIATIFIHAGVDPSFLIGTSEIPSLGQSGHYGRGEYFIAEADEYVSEPTHEMIPKLLFQKPLVAVITNIEFDHPDVYRDQSHVIDTMLKFVNENVKEGIIIINNDDSGSKNMYQRINRENKELITFGKEKESTYRIHAIRISAEKTTFSLEIKNQESVDFTIHTGGEHNIYNATAAIVVALQCGLTVTQIQKGIMTFTGSKRRMEYKGKLSSGTLIYDEYAHHPTEISRSLMALKAMYPDKKLVVIFQPHTFSRTKALFDGFTKAFNGASEVLLLSIYASLREQSDNSVSMDDLAHKINLNGQNAHYLPRPIDVIRYIQEKNYGSDTLIATMGAGDIYKIIEDLDIQYG